MINLLCTRIRGRCIYIMLTLRNIIACSKLICVELCVFMFDVYVINIIISRSVDTVYVTRNRSKIIKMKYSTLKR